MKLRFYFQAFFIVNLDSQIELGKTLFFDPRLSSNNKISCSSCHNPNKGWSDGRPTAIGFDNKVLQRKTPSIAYLDNKNIFFWDGRATSLEEQALFPITAPDEMNQDLDLLVEKLENVPGYVSMFSSIYPREGITAKTIAQSLASFERSLSLRDSPFDRWNSGQVNAISESAKKGYSVMSSLKANCLFCHKGNDFTDQRLWDIGVNGNDSGRDGLYAFKTPSLRDVALRAPYSHNGRLLDLDDVVRFYMRGGDIHRSTQASPQRAQINLTNEEVFQVVEFLKTLTTDNSRFQKPKLP